jgi:outer membrane protein OmpA-like peptidoglycan-associated protein
MNMPNPRILVAAVALLAVAACQTAPTKPDGAVAVRAKLSQLQADPQLAGRAPVAMKDAEEAVRTAEVPTSDTDLARYRVTMADRKVDTARAQAQSRLAEDQLKGFAGQRDSARLDARTREADSARRDAKAARSDADSAREDAAYANRDAMLAQQDTALAQQDAAVARQDASIANQNTAAAQQQSADLQQQIRELNARTTDRGIVVTLGDVLFASGGATLNGATPSNLNKLAAFLNRYPDRTVLIEGHTDSVGSAASNVSLSHRRADSVKGYLVGQGVASARLTTSGAGESTPVSDNESVTGRQQNRRVEVIISNTTTSQR